MFEQGFGYQPSPTNAEGVARFERIVCDSHARWEAMGLPSGEIDKLDGRASGFRVMRLPLDRAGESYTMNTEVACGRLLADFTDPKLGGLSLWTQPNSWHHFLSDHVVSFAALPIDAEHTLVRTMWCVHKDAREGVDYNVDNLTAVWRATNEQDGRLVEEVQVGVASGAYEPGPYSPYAEGLVEKFCNWYVQRMAAGLGA
jgi:Rieske 2Fe-2S family protein